MNVFNHVQEKVDININRMTAKAGEYKDKITSLQNMLAKEEEKKCVFTLLLLLLLLLPLLKSVTILAFRSSVLVKKLRSIEGKSVESSDPVQLLRKLSMSNGRKRSGNVVPYASGIFPPDSFGI